MPVAVEELTDRHAALEPAMLEGATLLVSAEPRIPSTAFTIENGGFPLYLDTETAGDLLLHLRLDPDSLAEPLPPELDGADLRFDYRLVHVEAAAFDHLRLRVPASIPAGAELRATVDSVDAFGNRIVDATHAVELIGPHGAVLLDEPVVMSEGRAGFRVLATATIPRITDVVPTTLTSGGEEVPGYTLIGSGVSGGATVLMDGVSFEDQGILQTIPDTERVWFGLPEWAQLEGEHGFQLLNPGGQSSEVVTISF